MCPRSERGTVDWRCHRENEQCVLLAVLEKDMMPTTGSAGRVQTCKETKARHCNLATRIHASGSEYGDPSR